MPKVAKCNGNKVITNGTYFAQLHKGQKKMETRNYVIDLAAVCPTKGEERPI